MIDGESKCGIAWMGVKEPGPDCSIMARFCIAFWEHNPFCPHVSRSTVWLQRAVKAHDVEHNLQLPGYPCRGLQAEACMGKAVASCANSSIPRYMCTYIHRTYIYTIFAGAPKIPTIKDNGPAAVALAKARGRGAGSCQSRHKFLYVELCSGFI